MVNAKDFWDSRAENYSKSPVRDEATYKEKLKTTQGYFDAESRVLEFGCGTGTTALHHAPFVKSIVATDISPNMIEIARDKAKTKGITNVEFRCATLEDIAQTEASFDMVMAHNILHLLEDPQEAIEQSYALLKPGGLFVTSTACLGGTFSIWRVLLVVGKIVGKVPFVNVMTRETLEQYFKDAGFETELQWNRQKMAAFVILKKPVAQT